MPCPLGQYGVVVIELDQGLLHVVGHGHIQHRFGPDERLADSFSFT